MFGALLLESSAGISLNTQKNHPNFELDRQKQTKHTLGTVFRQTDRGNERYKC